MDIKRHLDLPSRIFFKLALRTFLADNICNTRVVFLVLLEDVHHGRVFIVHRDNLNWDYSEEIKRVVQAIDDTEEFIKTQQTRIAQPEFLWQLVTPTLETEPLS